VTSFRVATAEHRPAWDAFVASRPEADPLQTWAWGEANATAGELPLRCVAVDDDRIVGVAQVLVRAASFGRSIGYVPHGPIWMREAVGADDILETLLRGIRDEARARGIIVVKIDPRSGAEGPDPLVSRLDRSRLRRARHDLQAPTTRIVELLDGGDALMATWDKDARNLVRRSAREGVVTETDTAGSPDAIGAFHGLLMETAERAGFRVRSETFLRTLAHELAGDRGWYLTLARLDGRPIAGAVALRVGSRAIYAYGASLREPALKHTHGAYACLAATMGALADDGVEQLDLWGVVEPGDDEQDASWAGFSAFKRQFGGTPLRHPGTFDLVVDPLWYRIRDVRERLGERLARR
jgi:lipid II:glycine glycyltransferase (peptidoglycan interpeptide bridge formation enzyme)